MKKHCPFCHQEVLSLFFQSHLAKHAERRPDGQQKDHYTVTPALRYLGSLEVVPQVYYHAKCGIATQMPEDIVRSYLVNPFLYNGNTFCCGCHTYVPEGELVWIDTGEKLSDYMAKLKERTQRN